MLSLLRRETRGKIRDPSHKLVIIHPDEPGVLSAAEFRSVQEKEDDILLESRSAALLKVLASSFTQSSSYSSHFG